MKLVALWAFAAIGLCGCTAGGGAVGNTSSVAAKAPVTTAVPTPGASVTPSSTLPPIPTTGPNVLPGAKVPVMPAAALEHSATGAMIFAANLVPALDWAYSTTNSAILRQYYSSQCPTCPKALAIYDDTRSEGDHFVGGHLTTKRVAEVAVRMGVDAERSVDVTAAAQELREVNGSGRVTYGPWPAQRATLEFSLSWSSGRWMVVSIATVSGAS